MKRFILALSLGLTMSSAALAQTIINGVEYREITDLGQPRVARAQPQLGSLPTLRNDAVRTDSARFAQYAPTGRTIWPSQAPSAADQRPALNAFGQPAPANIVRYNQPYAYGYGYVNGCAWNSPNGYANTLPPSGVQPISNLQPLTNVQPLANASFNPYQAQPRSVPLRPIVSLHSMPANYEVGQGIIGQPKIYVPSQPVRNFIRYITP